MPISSATRFASSSSAFRGAGDGVVAEDVLGERRDDARIDAAAERHEHALALGEVVPERRGLLLESGHRQRITGLRAKAR
jgi:hypothetical protein